MKKQAISRGILRSLAVRDLHNTRPVLQGTHCWRIVANIKKGCHTFSTLKGFPLVPPFSPKFLRLQANVFLGGGVTTPIVFPGKNWVRAPSIPHIRCTLHLNNCTSTPKQLDYRATGMALHVPLFSPLFQPFSPCCHRNGAKQSVACLLREKSGAFGIRATVPSRFLGLGSRQQMLRLNATEVFTPPPIDNDLHAIISDMGASFSKDGAVETFQNDKEALAAADTGVAVVEMSHFGRIRVSGDDRIRFLHNQSTADFQKLKDGQGCDTVFVTSTGRTIDLVKAWVMKNSVILFVSPSVRQSLCTLLNKYIFFADKVEVEDITDKTYFFSLVGPKSNEVLETLGLGEIKDKPDGSFIHYAIEGTPVTVGVGSGLAGPGYSFMLSTDTAGIVWEALLKAGAVPMGAAAWEQLRVWHGRPVPGKELTSDYNALEAGLWDTISLTKGCYIGQETIARLVTYDGVKQQLWSVHMKGFAEPGTGVFCAGEKVGTLTSCVEAKEGSEHTHVGLAYIRRKAGGAGLVVDVGGESGRVVESSFVKYGLPQ